MAAVLAEAQKLAVPDTPRRAHSLRVHGRLPSAVDARQLHPSNRGSSAGSRCRAGPLNHEDHVASPLHALAPAGSQTPSASQGTNTPCRRSGTEGDLLADELPEEDHAAGESDACCEDCGGQGLMACPGQEPGSYPYPTSQKKDHGGSKIH
ncbi:hypothetical protein ABZ721_35720 [Streptomyces sp. NPDC006733]|uniref:hypothetical protein n=1 Tax=Streptomyces sp. NPDC006733 TaxID=3155460 RepID=UPI0033E0F485